MRRFNQYTDTQLIHAFHEGDKYAFEALITRYKDKLFSSILYLVKDKYLAEDLFQETFIRIIDTIRGKRYNEEGKFLPWAMRIAHNLCVDYFRKIRRLPAIVDSDNNDVFEWLLVSDDNQEQKIIRQQSHDRVHRMLQELPEEQREVIVLRHFGDMSFKEIAATTNCSINTALGRMRYGLINLRRMMTERQIAL
ncbi:RNA polymerase sigma factor [Filimonas effusa]|uniref:Sigma-70 family RNA polymerase sigma factor n=1 Tax=Filimonas effusa TaxID=2508721 RepID=A0A4Q1D2C5_9BACT|nr:sigma-70 family RNA polymerase sigma factor [Filimonas effusa]RXK81231.1 sigma-70 family RNA polymerase sigma factor [Filimonas effusa]